MSYLTSDSSYGSDSVSDSINGLKLRLRTVREDCERYKNLEIQTNACFEDHRREINQLRQKERALSDVEVDRLQQQIHRAQQEVELLKSKAAHSRQERERLLREELHTIRTAGESRHQQLEEMLDTVRREWKEAHTEVWEAKKLEDGLTQSLLEELQAQEGMHVQLQEVKVAVAEEETARAMALRQTTSSGSPYRRRCRPCTKLFLPSGPVDPTDTTTPASHNARAMLATITRRNYQRPREYLQRHGLAVRYEECSPTRVTREAPKTVPSLVPPAAPSPATALHRASRMLLEELAELRESYYRYKTMLTDPRHGNTVEISQQIRECLNKLDKKAEQVRQLHREETKYGYRAHSVPDVLREIVRENKYCEAVYTDLLVLLRGQ